MDTLKPPPQGTHVQIRLARGDEAFEAQAKIVYVSRGLGMGVRFQEDMPEKQAQVLERWLAEIAKSQ